MNLTYGRYEQYELRMRSIARVLRWIARHSWQLITGAVLIAATFVFLGVVPGMFVENATCADQVYGEPLQYQAKVLLSDVTYEFATQDEGAVWSDEVPVLAGTYRIRAVSRNGYGKDRYSEEAIFTIHPAPLELKVKERTQIYGDISEYSVENIEANGLKADDHLETVSFSANDISISEMAVTVSDFTVVNANGVDVTASYTPSFVSGSLLFSRRAIGLSSKTVSKDYDGTPLCEPDCELISGSLAHGNQISYVHDPEASITVPGSVDAVFTAVITDEQGRDVTDNYEINYQYGTLTVSERPIMISIPDATKMYDGTPLTVSEYKIASGSLPAGTTVKLQYESNTEIIKVGSLEVLFTAMVYDGNGQDVTAYYSLEYDTPILTVTPRTISFSSTNAVKTYDGKALQQTTYNVASGTLADGDHAEYSADLSATITDVGTAEATFTSRIFNASGEDVSDQYLISYQFGQLTVQPRLLEIRTFSGSKLYDGNPLKNDSMTITNGTLVTGHTIKASYIAAPINAGEYINTAEFHILSAEGRDVTKNYDIGVDFGTLKIESRLLTIQSGNASKIYDGKALTSSKWQLISGTVAKNQRLTVTVTGSQTDVGESQNTMNARVTDSAGKDVTALGYKITLQTGSLRVTPRQITITSDDAIKVFDGKPLTKHSCSYLTSSLVLDHSVSATYTGSQTNYGSSSNKFTATIVTKAGKDVSFNYSITLYYGTLTVTYPGDTPLVPGDGDYVGDGDEIEGDEPEDGDEYSMGIPEFPSIYPVFQVEFANGGSTFLRQKSYGNYTGSGWTAAPMYKFTDKNPLSFAALNLQSSGKAQFQTVRVYRQDDSGLDYVPYYVSNTLPKGEDDNTIDYLAKNYAFTTATDYDFRVFEGVTTRSDLKTAEAAYRKFVYENYLDVPESTGQVLQSLADANGIHKDSKTLIKDIQAYIQHAATYNLNAKPYPKGVDQVVYFLTIAKEGVCQQYAASGTLMYRMFGIPARYTTGYSVSGEAGVRTEVMNTQAHAWVEIYLDGIGWVAVEVTGGSYATEPEPPPVGGGGGECDGDCNGDCGGADIGGEELSKLKNVIYARVRTDNATALYLRELSYGDYTGSGWEHAKAYNKSGVKPIYFAGEALASTLGEGTFQSVNIQLRPGCPSLLPYYTTDSFSRAINETDIDVKFSGTSYTMNAKTGVQPPKFNSVSLDSKKKSQETSYRSFVYNNYLNIPETTKSELLKIATQNGISADSPTLIMDVKEYIQNCATYNLDVADFPEGVDVALYFLTVAKEGYCQHFATAATLMYRALGIPARYTCGFMVETEAKTYVQVTGENAHAWVEVYMDGVGWVQVEVTALIEGVPTEKSGKTVQLRPDGKLYIDITTPSIEKMYDGKGFDAALTDTCIFQKGALLPGHQLKVTYNNDNISAGKSIVNNISEIKIVDSLGRDVTGNYALNINYGTLTILKRDITIRSIDATKVYDGTELTAGKWWISAGSLAPGHSIEVSVTGTITNEGTANNTFTYSIIDENGVVVNSQYNVSKLYGILKVTSR